MADPTIDEIKRRIDIVDVISQTVQLKRAGRSFKGLCPFHSEKTGSFTVSPERQTWHCFGCGEGGDVFSFVQRRDNLDFPEALRLLAERAGVEIEPRSRPDPAVRERGERLHAILESAALFYRAALGAANAAHVRAYLTGRGVTPDTIERFGLGYAEPTGRALEQHLTRAGFSVEEAVAAGALGQSDDGRTYDRFRERVIFPIRDADGRAIGFGGRALRPDQQPKYLNSPQSELFDKGASLYAIDLAAGPIRESRQAIVVEGYMDVIVAHQHGFRNVVATLGTALTERHVQVLRRLASEVILSLDADTAGIRAAIRGSEVAQEGTADEAARIPIRLPERFYLSRDTQVKVMSLPEGQDPDDVIRQDPAVWSRATRAAVPVVDFVIDHLDRGRDLTTPQGRREAAQDAMTVIQDLPDPIERDRYIQRLARKLNTREDVIYQLARTRPRRHQASSATPPPEPTPRYEERLQECVLALLLRAGPDAERPDPADFESAALREIMLRLASGPAWPDSVTALERLGRELGPAFEWPLQRLRAVDEENERLSAEDVVRELQVRSLELRKLRLFRQHQALDSVLREEADRLSPTEQRQYQERLAQLAIHLGQVFARQRELGVVGSASWSIRRGQEVLGG